MNSYFLTLVLKADQDEKERKAFLDSLSRKVTGKLDSWGTRSLAYPIKHQTSGFYAHFEFSADPSLAKDLDKSLRVEEDILRFLLVRNDGKIQVAKVEQKAQPVEEKPEKKMVRKKKVNGK